MAVRDLGVSTDEFWGMTFRELKLRLKGQRNKQRLQCGFAALIAQYIAAYSGAKTKGGGNSVPSVKKIVDDMMGSEGGN